MVDRVVPMIHVPDVRSTVDWYKEIGFTVDATYGDEGDGLSFAVLAFGKSQVMFNQGGPPSTDHRREVDLYVYTEKVDDIYLRLKDRVEIVEGPHDTFYGMRELIIRDLNRFWITFGQASTFALLMTGIREGNVDQVRVALAGGGLKPETLTAALALVTDTQAEHPEIVEILKKAGAVPPAKVDEQLLQSYAGKYQHENGFEINVTSKEGRLFAAPGAQEPLLLLALDQHTFRPIGFDDYGEITFVVEDSQTVGCVLDHGGVKTKLKRN